MKERDKGEALKTYDQKINLLHQKQYFAKQLYNYMATPEIQAKLERLPEEDIVEISAALDNCITDEDEISNPALTYTFADDDSCDKAIEDIETAKKLTVLNIVADEDNQINKQQISSWLDNIAEFLSPKQK